MGYPAGYPILFVWRNDLERLLKLANLAQFTPDLLGALNHLLANVGVVFANKRRVVFLRGVVHQLKEVVAHIHNLLHQSNNLLLLVGVEAERKVAIVNHLVYNVVNLFFNLS